jgi:sec-independent protein translocase protein TatA
MDLVAPWHLVVLLLIVLVIFGPRKLADLGGALGKTIRDVKSAVNGPDQAKKASYEEEESKLN